MRRRPFFLFIFYLDVMPLLNLNSSSSNVPRVLTSLTTRTLCLLGLLSILICLNIYFVCTIVLPSFTGTQPSPPFAPPSQPYIPPYYGVPSQRIPLSRRKFTSRAIDDYLHHKSKTMTDKDLVTLLNNCFPNTLDTTIEWYDLDFPHTFLITGDSKYLTLA